MQLVPKSHLQQTGMIHKTPNNQTAAELESERVALCPDVFPQLNIYPRDQAPAMGRPGWASDNRQAYPNGHHLAPA